MTGKWEQLSKGGEWETFWDVKATRGMQAIIKAPPQYLKVLNNKNRLFS